MIIMKKIAILVVACAVLLCACEKHMDEIKPYSIVTSQSMWNDEGDAVAGIAGAYNQFRSTFDDREFLFWFEMRSGFWSYGESGGGAGSGNWTDLFFNEPSASSTPATNWEDLYRTINGANLALKYIPGIDFTDEDKKNQSLADAYFIRAFTYFALARIFGDVPILTNGFESADAEDLNPVRKPVSEVFTLIKSDIDAALAAIPDDDPRDRIFASQAAINMLKADVYLWTAKRMGGGNADLDVAEGAVDLVLANTNYSLLADYEQVFRVEKNDEIIFSIYFDISEADNQYGRNFSFQIAAVPAEFHNNPVMVGGTQWFTLTDHYVNNYLLKDPADTRAGVINQDFDDGTRLFRWVNKFQGEYLEGTRFATTDTRVYRLAEAILFKAEILNAKGNPAQAVPYLNQIAERAYGVTDYYSTALTQAEVDDAILDERLIEFGAEGKSWFDMIRFGKAFERISSLTGREAENSGNILLFPINPESITTNPNITQTPGF
jgi:starch-binding outer membrane protein, SusD/RagB family